MLRRHIFPPAPRTTSASTAASAARPHAGTTAGAPSRPTLRRRVSLHFEAGPFSLLVGCGRLGGVGWGLLRRHHT